MITIKLIKFFNNNFSTSVLISSIISVIFGIVLSGVTSSKTIPLSFLLIACCISLFIIWALLILIFSKAADNIFSLNLILFQQQRNSIRCILQPCDYLSIGAYVTIFYKENNFEAYFATGIVENIQNDKLIQIKLIHLEDDPILKDKALNNDAIFLNSLILKPIITNKINEECN